MKTITDYMVLSDGSFELDEGPGGPNDVKQLSFNLPGDFTLGTNLAKPLLAYVVNFRSDQGQLGVWVNPPGGELLQSTRDHTLTWDGSDRHDNGLWEAIRGTKFEKGAENRIFIRVLDGRALFRDVVLWYQIGVDL